MSLAEVLPGVRSLSHDDKLRLVQLLSRELAESDSSQLITAEQSYPLWSPVDAFGAAETLLAALDAERAQP